MNTYVVTHDNNFRSPISIEAEEFYIDTSGRAIFSTEGKVVGAAVGFISVAKLEPIKEGGEEKR